MNFYKTFEQIKEEFDEETASLCICAMAIQLNTKVTNKDFLEKGRFTKRITKKVTRVLWEHEDKLSNVLEIIDAFYDYEIGKIMNGLGGCVERSLKDIIKRKT